jgi:hypothetical protein
MTEQAFCCQKIHFMYIHSSVFAFLECHVQIYWYLKTRSLNFFLCNCIEWNYVLVSLNTFQWPFYEIIIVLFIPL